MRSADGRDVDVIGFSAEATNGLDSFMEEASLERRKGVATGTECQSVVCKRREVFK